MKMNDDLLRLAFGELSDGAARAVEAQAAGEAKKELEALRDLRAGLQSLPPPPPDTLSADRLRAAILDSELRSRRPAPFSWAWAPVLVAAFAGIVLFTRSPQKVEPQIVSLGDKRPADPLRVPKPDFVFNSRAALNVPSAAPVASKALAVVQKAAPPQDRTERRRPARRRRPLETREVVPPPVEETDGGMRLAMIPTISAPPSTIVPGRPAGGGDDTVVLVSSKRDLETGAAAATETEASNVLVGG